MPSGATGPQAGRHRSVRRISAFGNVVLCLVCSGEVDGRVLKESRLLRRDADHRAEGKALHIENVAEVARYVIGIVAAVIGLAPGGAFRQRRRCRLSLWECFH